MMLLAIVFALSILSFPMKCFSEEKSVSTSIVGMEQLLETERELLTSLENYANELVDKAELIHSAIESMREENSKSLHNAEQYLSNPLHSYALIRRLHVDWSYWELFMESPVAKEEIDMVKKLRIDLPTSIDMDEANEGIFRMQTTYNLKAEDIAAGLLNGKQYNSSLSSRDCFELGRRSVSEENIVHSHFWLETSLQRFEEDEINDIMDFDQFKILDLLAEIFLKQDKWSDALNVVERALTIDPNNTKYLDEKLRIENEMKLSKNETKNFPIQAPLIYYNCCRGDFDYRLSRLHCRYNTTTHPFLKLAPFKMEEITLDPYLVIYHDVISDEEIAEVEKLSLSHLERTKVYDIETNTVIPGKIRTSKAYFILDTTNDITRRIVQRVGDMSGFDMKCSESMNVINYGLGGHYGPHHDFFNVSMDSDPIRTTGDRIATLMFYLSDVEQGGATVFPNIETTVYPRKGSAIMWHNMKNRGECDDRTLHASCPVIFGSKWVMTKWIREREQLFRKPCYKE